MELLATLIVLVAPASGRDVVYEGTWHTTNRKLDGPLTCVVTKLDESRWRGRFAGSFQGAQFAYTVDFTGPPEALRGRAVIDGADYEWTGAMGDGPPGWFQGSFWGSRY